MTDTQNPAPAAGSETPVCETEFPYTAILVKRVIPPAEATQLAEQGIRVKYRTHKDVAETEEKHAREAGRAGLRTIVRKDAAKNRLVDHEERPVDNVPFTCLADIVPDIMQAGYVLAEVSMEQKEDARTYTLILAFQPGDISPPPAPFVMPGDVKKLVKDLLEDSGFGYVYDNRRTSGTATVQIARPQWVREERRRMLRYSDGTFSVEEPRGR